MPEPYVPGPPASGLSDNAAGALAYFTFIPAIIFLIVAPFNTNSYVRFHSWQSILLNIVAFCINMFSESSSALECSSSHTSFNACFGIDRIGMAADLAAVRVQRIQREPLQTSLIGDFAAKQAGN